MLRTLLAGTACAALLVGCNQAEDPVNAVQDAASVPVGQMSAATMGANTVGGYVPNAAIGDMYEIQAAEIALERTANPQVRELAQMIVTDHRAASQSLMALAPQAAPDVTLPPDLDERRQGLIDTLRTANAAAFDQVFLDQQVAAHQEALTLHRGFADNTDAPQLATHAREVAPKIEMHLERARTLEEAM